MRIGVLSDTHLIEPNARFKKMIESHFKDVEKILHAGDFVDWSVAEYLSSLKELVAVCGNMDSEEIRMAFPRKRIIDLGTFRIALIHGSGGPFGIESRIEGEFERVDAIVYGHTHAPAHHRIKNVYFFNPGSPTRAAAGGGTLGILHLDQDIEGEIVPI